MTRTLRLAKETLIELSTAELAAVVGGAPQTLQKTCNTTDLPSLNSCFTGVYPTLDDCLR